MTSVRMKVAKSESMPCKPILAKIAVNEAKPAEANAQKSHALPLMFFLSESKSDLMGDGRDTI